MRSAALERCASGRHIAKTAPSTDACAARSCPMVPAATTIAARFALDRQRARTPLAATLRARSAFHSAGSPAATITMRPG